MMRSKSSHLAIGRREAIRAGHTEMPEMVQTALTGLLSAAWTGSFKLTKLGLGEEGDLSAYFTLFLQLHFQSTLQLAAEMLPPGPKAPGHPAAAAGGSDSDPIPSAALPFQGTRPEHRGCRSTPRTKGHQGSEGAPQPRHSDLPSSSFGTGLMCESCL